MTDHPQPPRRDGRVEVATLTLPPLVWLVIFFVIPVLILAAISLSPDGAPPINPVFS